MKLTYDIARGMIRERVDQYPPVKELVSDSTFDQTLKQILDFEGIKQLLFSTIRFDLMIVLTLYSPLNELAQNIAEDTGLDKERSESLVRTIKAVLIPSDLLEDLIQIQIQRETDGNTKESVDGRVAAMREVFDTRASASFANTPAPLGEVPDANNALRDELVLKPRTTEKIVERAVPEPGKKPLTREEILRSLAAKRTLQSDVAALQQDSQS